MRKAASVIVCPGNVTDECMVAMVRKYSAIFKIPIFNNYIIENNYRKSVKKDLTEKDMHTGSWFQTTWGIAR
jgi:hypothetical protein